MIVVIDFGSQYAQLIARRVRECKVYSELVSYEKDISEIKKLNPSAIILSGGPASVYDDNAPTLNKDLLALNIPILGICYGMQLLVKSLGGTVEKNPASREYGRANIKVDNDNPLFYCLDNEFVAWMSHGDSVTQLPAGFTNIGSTETLQNAAIVNSEKKIFGVQFHPEVIHTARGIDIIKNFVYQIAQEQPTWTMENYIETQIKQIREQVGDKKVLLGLSGGVDSTTVAALIHKAIGNQLTCMFIDQGFMRKDEAKRVVNMVGKYMNINLVHIDARQRFFDKIKGVTDPEEKRKRIGNEFVRTFEEESNKLGKFDFLAQGTLYPDIIESAVTTSKGQGYHSKAAAKIKTHHNVGGLPEDMQFKLIEPLKMLFKDEVRKLGRELGIHEEMINRHPFPGPGLAIRVLGEVTPERVAILQNADKIIISEIKAAGLYNSLWQVFGVLLPIRSVGVMGDQRTYANTIVLRAVNSIDAMTAKWAELPYELLEKISSKIINEVPEINRVVYDITSKPPGTIEWE